MEERSELTSAETIAIPAVSSGSGRQYADEGRFIGTLLGGSSPMTRYRLARARWTLLRPGLAVTISAIFFIYSFGNLALSTDLTAWHVPYGTATLALMLGITLLAMQSAAKAPHEIFFKRLREFS